MKSVRMFHPETGNYASAPEKAFQEMWSGRGWELAPEEPVVPFKKAAAQDEAPTAPEEADAEPVDPAEPTPSTSTKRATHTKDDA